MDEKTVKQEIQKLVDKFEKIKAEGKYKKYNEEQTKKNYILPLFRALGWDVESDDVKAEEKVSKKRVDYAFKINGVPKFYLECKPFREDISDPKYAKQAIEYAWNKSVTWAVLCNFEGIKVFNAEWKWNDKQPTRNRFLDLRYNEYNGSCFKYLTWLSRENFERGVLDEQATILGKKAKKLPISKQLLADFTEYRNLLSKDILRNNNKMNLSQEELDEIVQRILDRIIFIRTCEDKVIESEKLESLVRIHGQREGKLYKELNKKFRDYDEGYNSKLFREHLCESVIVGNDVLKHVIFGTYRSNNLDIRYDFSAINADILGNIYEQYLGHILKSTAKRAKLTNGKAHRKEQGIYYTPTYIVDYIVRNTLGEQLKKRKLNIDEIKILDPACGSGSFLIKAFDVLIEHTLKKESKGTTLQSRFEDIHSGSSGTLKRKTELLKNCIFGVDLDVQAVEITQLNLLLKLAEKRHRLPTLKENIRCGNSLIDKEELVGNKAFNFDNVFKEIMAKDGFDIIIGNPPYVNVYLMDEQERQYFNNSETYKTTHLKYDLYVLFIERAISLLKNKGYLGFIVPFSVLNQPYAELLRKYILENCSIKSIVDLSSYNVFQDATVKTCILILQKEKSKAKRSKSSIKITRQDKYTGGITLENISSINQNIFEKTPQNMFRLDLNQTNLPIIEKIKQNKISLGSIFYVSKGIVAYSKIDDRKKKDFLFTTKINNKCVPYLEGKDVERYIINYKNLYLEYDQDIMSRPTFPELHIKNKIIVRAMTNKLSSTFDDNGYFTDQKLILCSKRNYIEQYVKSSKRPKEKLAKDIDKYNELYILGILNSKLMWFYYKSLIFGGLSILPQDIRDIPIKDIDFNNIKEKNSHDTLVEYVKQMLKLHESLRAINNKETDKKLEIKENIKKYNNKIDDIVYNLYNLNKQEIKIVEESLNT